MTVSASSWLSLPIEMARSMISESSTFQTWTGVASAAAALPFIHMFETNSHEVTGPLCLVDWAPDFVYERESLTSGAGWIASGELSFYFADLLSNMDTDTPTVDFCNKVGGVFNDLRQLTVPPGRLLFRRLVASPVNIPVPDEEDGQAIVEILILATWRKADRG